jgi:hypothetical protein
LLLFPFSCSIDFQTLFLHFSSITVTLLVVLLDDYVVFLFRDKTESKRHLSLFGRMTFILLGIKFVDIDFQKHCAETDEDVKCRECWDMGRDDKMYCEMWRLKRELLRKTFRPGVEPGWDGLGNRWLIRSSNGMYTF